MKYRQEKELQTLPLGELTVIGMPPAKLVKALAVIAAGLHPLYASLPWIKPGHSRTACILTSLTVRDFLFRIGFTDAEVAPCMFAIRAFRGVEQLHSLGLGDPDPRQHSKIGKESRGWPGHLVVKLPKAEWLIDTTLFQARRPQWPDLPGMLAVPLIESRDPAHRYYEMFPLSGAVGVNDDGTTVDILWLDQPKNKWWRQSPDGRDRRRRQLVVDALVRQFGKWED